MALTATASAGFEFKHSKSGFPANAVSYEGSTGTTYTIGQLVTIPNPSATGSALLTSLTSTQTVNLDNAIVGVLAETATAKSTDRDVKVYDNPLNVYRVTFTGHADASAAAASTAANQFKVNLSTTASTRAANFLKGALIYIYDGPGKGDVRTITANTKANPTVVTVNGDFSATPTTGSKCIILAKASTVAGKGIDSSGVNIGTRGLSLSTDAKKVAIDTPGVTGYLNVVGADPKNLTLDVMIAPSKHAFLAGRTS